MCQSPSESYQHTQIGYLIIVALTAGLLLCAGLLLTVEFNAIALGVLILLAICLWLFATLTVTVDDESLAIRFGPGLVVRKRWLLNDINDAQVVRNRWYYGWGIHLTPHGWLYNVSGMSAVQITLSNGKRYRIGSDEPKTLTRAIRKRLKVA